MSAEMYVKTIQITAQEHRQSLQEPTAIQIPVQTICHQTLLQTIVILCTIWMTMIVAVATKVIAGRGDGACLGKLDVSGVR